MICNLTGESFCMFGSIPGRSGSTIRANRHSISLTPDTCWIYRTSADTWVAHESGTVILSVSQDGVHFRDFFLDRPVVLRDGIWFSLTAFGEVASAQIAAVLLPSLERTDAADDRFVAIPHLRVKRIYSLQYQEKEPGFLFPGERGESAELVYVDTGSIHCVVEGQELLLQQGDMIFYGPGQWHMQYAQAECAPRLVSVVFDAEGLDPAAFSGRRFASPQRAILLLQQMLREQERMDAYSQDMIFGLFTQLLLQLQREEQPSRQAAQLPQHFQNENAIVSRAQQYIGEHVCGKLSVPVVAQGVGVSASYLTALFQKHLQIAPAEYIRRIKLQKSKQLIREGKLNFTQIARTLQYSTVHHFSRQFKEKFGITPTEYARMVHQEV